MAQLQVLPHEIRIQIIQDLRSVDLVAFQIQNADRQFSVWCIVLHKASLSQYGNIDCQESRPYHFMISYQHFCRIFIIRLKPVP